METQEEPKLQVEDIMADDSDNQWVKIISEDGFQFVVRRSVAMGSGTLKGMLSVDSGFVEASSGICTVHERGAVVEKIIEYLTYKKLYENAGPREDIPDFQERVTPQIALELLMAADYLET